MDWYIPLALVVAFFLGACVTLVIMSLLTIGMLGDDPLPEIEAPQDRIVRHYQD